MKNLLTKALSHTAQILPFRYWQGLWGDKLFLPFYHLVSDESPPHVRQLYPVRTERQFREDLDFLLKHFQPIDLQTLWEHVFEKRAFDRPVFHLSFDDGLRECHELVMPILLEKGIPATFFLNPDFIDNQGLMYRYKASLLSVAHLQGVPHFQNPLAVKYENRHLLDNWAKSIGLDFAAFLADQKPYLSTAQIQDMQAKGFTFGAHSLDHPQYGQIPVGGANQANGAESFRSKKSFRCRAQYLRFPLHRRWGRAGIFQHRSGKTWGATSEFWLRWCKARRGAYSFTTVCNGTHPFARPKCCLC